jgi:hypothetical protein
MFVENDILAGTLLAGEKSVVRVRALFTKPDGASRRNEGPPGLSAPQDWNE